MSTTTTSVSGLASGIDSASIIDALIKADRQAISTTETKKTTAQSELSVVQSLNSLFAYVASDAEYLTEESTFAAHTATGGDDDVLTATATSAAATGTYSLRVDALAQAEQVIGTAVDGSSTYSGTLTVTVGSGTTFSYQASNASLATIAAAINRSSTAGAKAEVVDVGDGTSRLMLTSKSSGAANTIALGGDLGSSGPFASTTTLTKAQDASVTVKLGSDSSIEVTRTSSTNAMTNVVDGVTLSLTATSTDYTSLTVARNTSEASTRITSFVTSLNNALASYKSNASYDATTETAGALFSNTQVRIQVNGIISAMDGAGSNGTTLETLGISYNSTTRKFDLDSDKLCQALADDPDAVANLFISSGLGTSINDAVDKLTNSGTGTFTTLEDGLAESITSYTKRITDFDAQLEVRRQRYEAQFLAMEKAIASLNSQKTALTSFIDGL